jgi:hypothetical protein
MGKHGDHALCVLVKNNSAVCYRSERSFARVDNRVHPAPRQRRDELDIRQSMVGSAARCAVKKEIFISAHHALCDRRAHIRIVLFAGQDDNIPPVRSVSEGIEIAYDQIRSYAEILKIQQTFIGSDDEIALPCRADSEEVAAADYMTNFVHVITVRPFL